MSPAPSMRDDRIDLLKGLALGMILVDHVEDAAGISILSDWTLRACGPSDAAELFVLLSGLVVGRSYLHRLEREGFWRTQRHALLRTLTIAAAALLAALLLAALLHYGGIPSLGRPPRLATPAPDTWAGFLANIAVNRWPRELDILVLYLTLLPLAPVIVSVGRRSLPILAFVSATVYVSALLLRHLAPLELDLSPGYFRAEGWQFLYCIGVAAGIVWRRRGRLVIDGLRDARSFLIVAFVSLSVLVLGAGWLMRPEATSGPDPVLGVLPLELRNLLMAGIAKQTPGPLRIVHAIAVLTTLLLMLPAAWARSLPLLLRPLALCGRYSLLTFTAGAVITPILAGTIVDLAGDPLLVVLIEANGLAMLVCVAMARSRFARTSRDQPPRLSVIRAPGE